FGEVERSSGTSAWRARVAATLIVACTLAAYSNSFHVPFSGLDDKQSIRDNPHIRHLLPLSEAMSLPMWSSGSGDNEDKRPAIARRPVLSASFALTYRLFGLDPRPYHALNLAIHVLAGLCLFGIVRRTLRRVRGPDDSDASATWVALLAALIWLLHPLQTES